MTLTQKPDVDGKRRFSPIVWIASLTAIAVLALGITGTLAAFTSSITNSANNVQTIGDGDFGFSESNVDGGVTDPACIEASAGDALTCATVNKNGEAGAAAVPMAPGDIRTTTVRMANTAAAPNGLTGQLTLTPAACTQTPLVDPVGPPVVGDLCGVVTVAVACAGLAPVVPFTLPERTLTNFNTGAPTPPPPPYLIATLAPGEYTDCTFTTTLPASVTDPSLLGITTSQPMTWTFTQV
jgi:predicted ribosomally synthesized peptide with SipW-like signal peptide